MDFETSERDGGKRIHSRLGPSSDYRSQKVCFHWQAGKKCNRHPCPFLHVDAQPNRAYQSLDAPRNFSRGQNPSFSRGPNQHSSLSKWGGGRGGGASGAGGAAWAPPKKVCHYWIGGQCQYGNKCRYLHAWSIGELFTLLTPLNGHEKAVSGIALPSGSDKLYSGSRDESVRLWDCQTGLCAGIVNLGAEVGCLISEGPWIFVGLPNVVKAWNAQTNTDLSLSGPVGQVYTMVASNEMLFAGAQDGNILVWRYNAAINCFEPAASLRGHHQAVVCLVVGAQKLFSSSMDKTIKLWDLATLQCIQTLTDHTSVVMSVLCWDQFLLSCSLDKTIKVWAATESGNLEVMYTHNEEHGVIVLCGMLDAQAKPVLFCSCNDNCVRLYDLPSFSERGKIFSKEEVRSIQTGPGGLFFTGDGKGEMRVWKWMDSEPTVA